MNAPAIAAQRLGMACLLGCGLGLYYGFLRPLRPRWTGLSDLLFLIGAFWIWLYMGFGVCRGDLRFGYTAGLAAGGFLWECTVGRWLRPVFGAFWRLVGRVFRLLLWPAAVFLKKFFKIAKFLFASGKKWGTMVRNNRKDKRRRTGGAPRGNRQ